MSLVMGREGRIITILRLLSILAFTLAQTILYKTLFTPKFGGRITLAVTVLYCFWMNFCNEFLFTSGYAALAQAVMTAAFLQIVFRGGLMKNYIQNSFMGLAESVVSLIFGGCAGTIYRLATGTDEPLWISGEELGFAGLCISFIYLAIVVLVSSFLVPRFASCLYGWRRPVVYLVFGICVGLEVVNVCLTISIEKVDDLDVYLVAYGVIFLIILLVMLAGMAHMVKSAQKKRMENRLLEAKIHEQRLQYEFAASMQQEIREIRHDLINHLASSGGGIQERDTERLR